MRIFSFFLAALAVKHGLAGQESRVALRLREEKPVKAPVNLKDGFYPFNQRLPEDGGLRGRELQSNADFTALADGQLAINGATSGSFDVPQLDQSNQGPTSQIFLLDPSVLSRTPQLIPAS